MRGRIEVKADIHFGRPFVAGTRIPVEDVLELVAEGIPFTEIIERYYPALTFEDIRACVRYATEIVADEEIHIAAASV
jgi:uncharacterized protein (DUF433 family)